MASNRNCSRVLVFSAACLLQWASVTGVAAAPSAETEVFLGPPADSPSSQGVRPLGPVGKGLRVDLPPPPAPADAPSSTPAQKTESAPAPGAASTLGPAVVGSGRDLPAPVNKVIDPAAFDWVPQADGGQATTLVLASPEARALRAGLLIYALPNAAQVSFFSASDAASPAYGFSGSEINRSLERDRQTRDADSPDPVLYWSPVIEGDALGITLYLPAGIAPSEVRLAIPKLSHITARFLSAATKLPIGPGASEDCEKDVSCYLDGWGDVAPAVAKIVFTTASGQSSVCSGTLLADSDPNSQIPYFLTANHCVSRQVEASSMQTYWFYRTRSCNSKEWADVVPLGGGATLLSTLEHPDATLVRLDRLPPAGVTLAGWSAETDYLAEKVAGIHHPRGDLQKLSWGQITNYATCDIYDASGAAVCAAVGPEGKYVEVDWSLGLVEQGSSGSGIFAGADHKLRGVLSIGEIVGCEQNQRVWYSRFDLAYNLKFHTWLAETSACNAEVGSWAYCSNVACGPCAQGQGDCDTDAHCKEGLVCLQDVGEAYGYAPTVDVCEVPGAIPPKLSCDLANGSWDFCADARCGPCALGQGDCDTNSECAVGLVCLPNTGAQFGLPATVDVCTAPPAGACTRVNGDRQLCSDPNCGPCQAGQGDCDRNAECAAGLICAFNAGEKYGLPATLDVCELPPENPCTKSPGDWGYCADPACGPCQAGQGDCDSNAECAAGLTCVYNVGEQHGLPATMDVCEAPVAQ